MHGNTDKSPNKVNSSDPDHTPKIYTALRLSGPVMASVSLAANWVFYMQFVKQPLLIILVLAACSMLQLSGCATTYKEAITSYNDAQVCCKTMGEFLYETINVGQSKEFLIDKNSQAFAFNSGKSYFKAFMLPTSAQPYHVKIESYSLASNEGPSGDYVFYPALITLDKNYNILHVSDPRRFQPLKNTFLDQPSFIFWQNAGFKLRGQLPVTEKSNEKYLVILTTDKSMEKNTIFPLPNDPYGFKQEKSIVNSPHGAINISLVRPGDLNKDEREEWMSTYEAVRVDDLYAGYGFTVFPPRHHDYRFKDLSNAGSKSILSYLNFLKFVKGESAVAFVISFYLDGIDLHKGTDEILAKMVNLAKKHHEENFYPVNYEISKINIGAADCRRIDYYAKSKYMFFLPMRGYDIVCLHPERSDLVVRIATSYAYPLGESTSILPKELSDFYRGLHFKSLN